jgi:diacylglycerol kinase family enzyme
MISTEMASRDIAVLLNANAKMVTDRVQQALSGVVSAENLFLSRDPSDASTIADTVLDRGYGTVFTGGGDGTFVAWVNHILDRAERRLARAPRFGVLALGTGNAVAEMVGARPHSHVEELQRFLRGEVPYCRRIDLVSCEGRRTPFAGVGVDAAILNDYHWLRQQLGKGALRRFAQGIGGYGLAVALRSAPRQLVNRRAPYCEVTNAGRPAWRLDDRGRRIGKPIEQGEMLYAGPCIMAAGGTVPYYGFGLKAFPFALSRPGLMHLRIAGKIPVSTLLWNVSKIWTGDFHHPGLLDFQVERAVLEFEKPMPFQIGGDAEGWREEMTLGMAPQAIEVVDFTTAATQQPAAA